MIDDAGPVFGFAEEISNVPVTELSQRPQGEDLAVGFIQTVKQPMDAHAFILTHDGLFRTYARIGKRRCFVYGLRLLFPLFGNPDVLRYSAEPAFNAAVSPKLI